MAVGDSHVSDLKRNRTRNSTLSSEMTTMRIAVAGTGNLACLIAHYIQEGDTIHNVVLLSRSPKPHLLNAGYQVAVVNYNNQASLQYALRGVDTVISTVTGDSQIELIDAAVTARVRRFAPAEFEGIPRPQSTNAYYPDRSKMDARRRLAQYANRISSTIFVCGIMYERFHPGGLAGARMGLASRLSCQSPYIMDFQNMSALVPADANRQMNVTICMTAAQDVARFVTKALDLPIWPDELFMYGERVNVWQLVHDVQRLQGRAFNSIIMAHPALIEAGIRNANTQRDPYARLPLHALLNTAEGHYDYEHPNLNQYFQDVVPMSFATWFRRAWNIAG